MSKPEVIFAPPSMSWDIPIEQELLRFVRTMKNDMRSVAVHREGGWFNSGAKEAHAYANAYETVEQHILRELKLRGKIADAKQAIKGGENE